jgi:hypothetical protein
VCSVSTTILVGDSQGTLLSVGNGGAFQPSVGKLYWEPAGT